MGLTTRISDLNIDDSIFEPIKTDNPVLNDFLSNSGGIMPATATMLTGSPGSGKTTLVCEMLSDIQAQGGKTLFISMEMNEIDMASYTKRFPAWNSLNIYFPDFESDIWDDVKTLLESGFDVVAIDSFKELKDIVADEKGWTKTKTERKLISLMNDAMIDESNTGKNTAFYVIQQVLKSGDFAGSKRLEHLMTANLKMVVDGNESYLKFEKNRRGDAHRKLFYQIKEGGMVFDGERREMEEEAIDFTEEERERQKEKQKQFDDINDLLSGSSGGDSDESEDDVMIGSSDDTSQSDSGDVMIGGSNDALPETSQGDSAMDDTLMDIQDDVEEPVTDKTEVDPEILRRVFEYENGNLNATRRTMHEIGAAPELTYYYAKKIAEEAGVV